jgi:hypothetical protein
MQENVLEVVATRLEPLLGEVTFALAVRWHPCSHDGKGEG